MNIKKLRIILACAFSLLGIVSATLGFTSLIKQKIKNYDYACWVNDVEDDALLRNLSIPGSHDTMALHSIGDLAGKWEGVCEADKPNQW